MIARLKQLWLDLRSETPVQLPPVTRSILHHRTADAGPPESRQRVLRGRDSLLEDQCRALLQRLGMTAAAKKIQVCWNQRLRSSAGYASFPAWKIELNPRLAQFDGQVERTLKHELAHLIAFQRTGHTRIDAHGHEWRKACRDLGIPDERAHHHLPLPRNQVKRNYIYECQSCGIVVKRVRRFRRKSACKACCLRHGDGNFDPRFLFKLVKPADKGESRQSPGRTRRA